MRTAAETLRRAVPPARRGDVILIRRRVRVKRGMRLPTPMLARSAAAPPSGSAWSYEPKMDGYRCMVDTHGGFRARSRRGWAMADLVPELAQLPPGLMLDGELVSFDAEG